ncbi:MAG: hypothetical protein WBM24_24940 [Candidatus Sulfotelmatobacter sp.]
MKLLDRLCAGTLFILAIVDCWLVPRTYTGRIWILGTALALLFTAMLNLLRVRNGSAVRGLKMFCIAANILILTLVVALMLSIGEARTLHNPQIIVVAILVFIETTFSLGTNA